MISQTGKVDLFILMVMSMKENGLTTKHRVKVFTSTLMAPLMKGHGIMMFSVDKE